MIRKDAETIVPINQVIARRFSTIAFDKDKEIKKEQIIALCEAARWSPNCFNDQPFRYIIANKFTNPKAWDSCFDAVLEGNKTWIINVPVLFICLANNTFRHNGKTNDWAKYDCGAASQNLCLQAVDMGLASHQIAGFNAEKLRNNFSIDEKYSIMSVIAIGYQADENILEAELLKRETLRRARLPLNEIFFDGDLSKGIV